MYNDILVTYEDCLVTDGIAPTCAGALAANDDGGPPLAAPQGRHGSTHSGPPWSAGDRGGRVERRWLVELATREFGELDAPASQEISQLHDRLGRLEQRGYAYASAEASLVLLLAKTLEERPSCCDIEWYRVIGEWFGGKLVSEASVKLRVGGRLFHTVAEGAGPIAAMAAAFSEAIGTVHPVARSIRVVDHVVSTLPWFGTNRARTQVVVTATDGESTWTTIGVSEDLLEAGWAALRDMVEYRLLRVPS